MRVLLHAPSGHALEAALAAHGLELVRTGLDADALVTVTPEPELDPLADIAAARWESDFERSVAEPFFAAQRWLGAAVARGSGSWVAVTSVLATQPFPGGGAAGAAGLALQTLVRVAAVECGPHGVRANAVAAGWWQDAPPAGLDEDLARDDTPLRRLATPADVAAAVAWLLSPAARHVSGEVLRVDGGYTITRGSRPDPREE